MFRQRNDKIEESSNVSKANQQERTRKILTDLHIQIHLPHHLSFPSFFLVRQINLSFPFFRQALTLLPFFLSLLQILPTYIISVPEN
jgi:hypothetical protein